MVKELCVNAVHVGHLENLNSVKAFVVKQQYLLPPAPLFPLNSWGSSSFVIHHSSLWIGVTSDAKAETPVLWPPHAKSWLIGKDSDAGRDWGQEEKGTTEDEMAGWHHQLDGREFEWTPGVGDGQGGVVCWDSWGHKESDTTERLNWTEPVMMPELWDKVSQRRKWRKAT